MKISFVIPCYRSERTIQGVVEEIKAVISSRQGVDYEIIMVSDHSPDNVYSVIEKMCAADPQHLRGILLAKNFGQQAALMAGFSRSSGDIVFSLDDDGQAPVDAIYQLVDKIDKEGFDVVYGSYPVKKHSLFRNFGSLVNHYMAVCLVGKPKDLRISSFYAVKRFVLNEMLRYHGPYPYPGGLIYRATKNIASVEVNHRARKIGTSGYTFRKLFALWMNGFTAFSVKPLRCATWLGFACASLGFVFGLWTIVNKLFIHPEAAAGYSSLMAVILFIGGMLMLILGLIGEYVGRIYICLNQSPQYVVSKETAK